MNNANSEGEILHILEHEKFIPAFIALVDRHLETRRHHFFFVHNGQRHQQQGNETVTTNAAPAGRFRKLWNLARALNKAEKIVLHGLFNPPLILLLCLQPWLLARCYWFIWGGDLYVYAINRGDWRWRIKEWFRRPIIKRFGHLVTYVSGDVELARQWYGARGVHHECILYPSNTFQKLELPAAPHEGLHFLVGNSADPSNEHIEVLQLLHARTDKPIKVFVPLSYGNPLHAQTVIEQGEKLLGARFVPLREFMAYDDYVHLLAGIDIAIFNHRRQQGMGNIIALLGMGKTVCLRPDTTSWQTLTAMGLHLCDARTPCANPLPHDAAASNQAIVARNFSTDVLIRQLREILEN